MLVGEIICLSKFLKLFKIGLSARFSFVINNGYLDIWQRFRWDKLKNTLSRVFGALLNELLKYFSIVTVY